MANNVYIGMRYVPKFIGNWDSSMQTVYEPLNIVMYNNSTYTSKQEVPTGINITNTDYWVLTGNYNGQITNLQNQIDVINSKLHPAKYILISDSYGIFTNGGVNYSWIDDVISKTGINAVKIAAGSIGFRPPHGGASDFLTVLQNAVIGGTLGDRSEYTNIIVCGGANDITGIAAGDVSKSDLITNISTFITYCKTQFINAEVSIGFIGNLASGNYAYYYHEALEAYRSCVKFGAKYLKNVEYILQPKDMLNDGIHPDANGFAELGNYLADAVLSGSCQVDRSIESVTFTSELPAAVGAWNLTPPIKISQHNGTFRLSNMRPGCNIVMDSANRLDVDNIVAASINNMEFKLFQIGRVTSHNLKGAKYSNGIEEIELLENVPVFMYTTTAKYFPIYTPLALIQGVLYLCIPKNATAFDRWTGDTSSHSDNIYHITLGCFDISIDTSEYNGQQSHF